MPRISPDKPREIWRTPHVIDPLTMQSPGSGRLARIQRGPTSSNLRKKASAIRRTRACEKRAFFAANGPGAGRMKRSLQNEGECRGPGRAARAINVMLEAKAIQKYSR
ncbi:hypothetical protein CIRG_06126 [Coccidioides immitis RMSCC 2394]|uniref:Uncharacterized protein n=1 Tax=Coccidioides immitis RMSCC 2394 TaxID=404692 RepID=A0A0J6YFI9_COCIT|nr:hypothetical protein CIRG_06126 [Coccidioides immitis RMSCC 2394]